MSSKKNIDRIFQERFKDFEATPPMTAWDAIEKELDGKKPTATTFPLWLKWIGIAAGIALLATLAYKGFNQNTNHTTHSQELVDTDNIDNNSNSVNQDNTDKYIDVNATQTENDINLQEKNSLDNAVTSNQEEKSTDTTNINLSSDEPLTTSNDATRIRNTPTTSTEKAVKINTYSSSTQQEQSYSLNNANESNYSKVASAQNPNEQIDTFAMNNTSRTHDYATNHPRESRLTQENINTSSDHSTETKEELPKDTDIAAATDLTNKPTDSIAANKDLTEAIAQKEYDHQQEQEIPFKKWNATSVIAPVYSNTAGGSSIDTQFADNGKAAGVNLSYGVNIGYHINPRLSVRTGVHRVNMSYTTKDIIYSVQVDPLLGTLSTESYNKAAVFDVGGNTNYDIGSSFSQEFLIDNTFSGFQGEISQRLGYLEVPLEIKYKLIDRKLSLNVMGGMSALFLTENSIAVTDNRSKLELGEDSNFNNFNQSANFGIGIDYLFTDQLGLSVEPMFKYQLNALRENTANFRPFTIGVYSGITYKF